MANRPERGGSHLRHSPSRYETDSTERLGLFGGTPSPRKLEEAEMNPSDSSSVSSESSFMPLHGKSRTERSASPKGLRLPRSRKGSERQRSPSVAEKEPQSHKTDENKQKTNEDCPHGHKHLGDCLRCLEKIYGYWSDATDSKVTESEIQESTHYCTSALPPK